VTDLDDLEPTTPWARMLMDAFPRNALDREANDQAGFPIFKRAGSWDEVEQAIRSIVRDEMHQTIG
jgi:hypothetical protein